MKKILRKVMLSFMVVLATISLNAQNLQYGVKVGKNISVQSEVGDLYNNDDFRNGLHTGVFGKYQLNDKVYLQSEINYDQKGSSDENTVNKFDYLTIPVLVGYSLGESRNSALKFNIYGGPYAGILINAESKTDIEGVSKTTDLTDQTNNAEVGLMGGFIVKYPFDNKSIFLDLRFGLSLSPYGTNDYKPPKSRPKGPVNLGFKKGNQYGRNCKKRKS